MEALSKARHNLLFYVYSEGESCVDNKRAHGKSIIPGDFNSLSWGYSDFAKACFVKAGDSMLFLVFFFFIPNPSFFRPPLPLLLTSLRCVIILRRALLTSETPLCTQVLLKAHSSPHQLVCVSTCARSCVRACACWRVSARKPKRWIDSVWQTGLVIQYFKRPSTPSTPTRPGPNSKLLSV